MPRGTHIPAMAGSLSDLGGTLPPALLDAGKTLASLADPDRDLCDLGGLFSEVATSVELIGKGLYKAHLEQIECRDKHAWLAFDRKSRETAARTAKRALIDLAALLGSIEAEIAEHDRRAA